MGLTAVLFGTIDLIAKSDLPSLVTPDEQSGPLLQILLERLIAEESGSPPYSPGGVHQMGGAGFLPGQIPELQREKDAISLLMRKSLGEVIFSLLWHVLAVRSSGEAGQWGFPPGTSSFAGWPPWLAAVLGEVSRDPALSIEDLALRAGITEVQVRRVFRRHLGVTPSEYLRRTRLDAARRLLETTDWTVATITERVGFESPSHFTRLFKGTFGYSPAQHRRLGA